MRKTLPSAGAPTDGPAAALAAYLNGMATGIAGTRRAMSEAGPDEVEMADRLSLVAGLIAGGAALTIGVLLLHRSTVHGRQR